MRIGIESKHLDAARGGAEAYTHRLTAWLSAKGHDVHLFSADSPGRVRNTTVHCVAPFSPRELERRTEEAGLDVFVGTDTAESMDVFHPHRGTIRGNQHQEIARIAGGAVRAAARGFSHINPGYHRKLARERRQVRAASDSPVVIAVSRMVANEFRHQYNLPDERLRLVYNGVDCSWFSAEYCARTRGEARRQLSIPAGLCCFLSVANDFARKGVKQLIQAVAELGTKTDRFCCLVVGRDNPAGLRSLVDQPETQSRVRFLPVMNDVRTAYAAADAFVLPSWYDPCSLTVLEAMACGLAVITTTMNGASELIDNGKEGFVIPSPGEIGMLAGSMERLIDPGRQEAMGHAGRKKALEFDQERSFSGLLNIITQHSS